MNGIVNQINSNRVAALCGVAASLMWVSQPPFCLWLVAFVALVPWLMLIDIQQPLTRRGYVVVWLCAFLYWLISLQGLRHAHWAIYPAWVALAAYLSVYNLLFVSVCRRMINPIRAGRSIPIWIAAPVTWVGLECVRNYFITGISAAMLGHTMADVPVMIQIADLFGTYGISFVLVTVNVAVFCALKFWQDKQGRHSVLPAVAVAGVLMAATIAYGFHRVGQTSVSDTDSPLATFALIQRAEVVEYVHNPQREVDIFRAYERETVRALQSANVAVDAVVWPESMMSAGNPWFFAEPDAIPPAEYQVSAEEFQLGIRESQDRFCSIRKMIQDEFASFNQSRKAPHWIGGCGVVGYSQLPHQYNGIVNLGPDGSMQNWYGKTHLVLVGEYIPVLGSLPGIRSILPMLTQGDGPKQFVVGETTVAPNICIETAVERVTINQMGAMHSQQKLPDVIVTVTNDGWFDDSSVIDHHLRCAQLVAVGARRPILSSANNGPTAWIDSCGQIVKRLETGTNGSIIATPLKDSRTSLYIRIGDWPARLLAIVCIIYLLGIFRDWRNQRRERRLESAGDPDAPLGPDVPLGTVETK